MASETNKPPSNPSASNNNNNNTTSSSNHDEADLAKVSRTQNFPENHIDHRDQTNEAPSKRNRPNPKRRKKSISPTFPPHILQ
ncbi:uncharacterized protein K489DRAFT_378749 [Dissoconium aciculare CBS 342.82]|uniref:Uncharacterized protein n=1 Tax=Dissoconium aciculare CBS 342.82 TaxID=1314786 RepID=A0A6J3MBW9_9PEZI|nr:uncharacterized protein K489DRAFT_378749 [Dissoconium aciculare CBS 342.82]KAF1824337.1 hypothetical protein K489DRAFT_378749 [Dissoconium aciculare CBS 342.82]